jgi:predicted dehydrogenase
MRNVLVALCLCACSFAADEAAPIRVGMLGLDTSHAVVFPKLFDELKGKGGAPAVKIVAGFPMAMADNPASASRVDGYTATLRKDLGVEIVASIAELLARCDAVMVESVDGRAHLAQARAVFGAGKPVFIDKPLAGSYADAREIVRLARETKTPFFSASALRFCGDYQAIKKDAALGAIAGCAAFSPCALEPHHPDFYWYGIHGVEPLFLMMGRGCVEVSRIHTEDYDLAVGRWADGRIGTFRGVRRGYQGYGVTVWGEKGVRHSPGELANLYEGLVIEVARFFKTKQAPVDPQETLEIMAFMSAADKSKERGGAPVTLKSLDEQP